MSRHARIEEVFTSSESSGDDSDPDIMDPTSLAVLEPVQPRRQAPPSSSSSRPPQQRQQQQQQQQQQKVEVPKADHTWVTLYPLYFDAGATHAQGRRVSKSLAVSNPLAKGLADAAAYVVPARGVQSVLLEPGKRHPADWANPGRIRVKVRDANGKWIVNGGVKNTNSVWLERMLYKAIADYLKKHPTTVDDPFSLPVRGLPIPEGNIPPPAAPRGWRINTILPLHSAAMTGGGVSDNIMKDIQAAMGGGAGADGLLPGMGGSSAGQGKLEAKKEKKKDKKKK